MLLKYLEIMALKSKETHSAGEHGQRHVEGVWSNLPPWLFSVPWMKYAESFLLINRFPHSQRKCLMKNN